MKNTPQRDSFVFYRSFFEAISDLQDSDKVKLYEAICDMALNEKQPTNLTGITATIWKLMLPNISANTKKAKQGSLGAEHGKKGGRPPKKKPEGIKEKTPEGLLIETPIPFSIETPNEDVDVDVNVDYNEDVDVDVVTEIKTSKKEKPKFIPPTLDEVKQYFIEKGYKVEAAVKAWDYYEAGDWIDKNGSKVLKWKQKMTGVWFKPENKTNPNEQAEVDSPEKYEGYNHNLHGSNKYTHRLDENNCWDYKLKFA